LYPKGSNLDAFRPAVVTTSCKFFFKNEIFVVQFGFCNDPMRLILALSQNSRFEPRKFRGRLIVSASSEAEAGSPDL
jgi:hypothetical protein